MNMTVPATSVDPVAVIQAVFQRARQQQLPLAELIQTVERLSSLGASAPALDLYKTWIAFNDKNPMVHVASFNYAVMLNQTGDAAGAIQALKATIAYKSDFAPAHINLGRVYEDCQMVGRAVEQWRNFANTSNEITAERLSFRLMALKHMGRVLETAGLLEEAEAVLWLAIELDPTKQDASQHWLATRQHQCKWPIFTSSEHVTRQQLTDAMSPMTIACFADDPLFQLGKAYRYNKKLVGRPDTSGLQRKPTSWRPASAFASAICLRTCANMRSASRSAKSWSFTTRKRSRFTAIIAAFRAATTRHMTVSAPSWMAGAISTA